MANIHKEHLPKYMNTADMSQYELACSIDAAIEAAELSHVQDNLSLSMQLLYSQIIEQIYEDFGIHLDQAGQSPTVADAGQLLERLRNLIPQCAIKYHIQHGPNFRHETFRTELTQSLQRSIQDALDIIHARDLWRFDIERTIKQIQEHLMDAVERYSFQQNK